MSDSSPATMPKDSFLSTSEHEEENLEALRRLLLAPERAKVAKLEERLDKLPVDAQAVSKILPNAIGLSNEEQIASSLRTIISRTLIRAIKGSPEVIAHAISPIIGSAIRKAVANALRELVQKFDRMLNHSVSWQGVRWRIEAWQTGKSFGEVILLHTLQYRVERVYLIHRDRGILLHDLQHPAVQSSTDQQQKPIAGMLTAITTAVQKFSKEEFKASPDASLKSFEMDDGLVVWIEHGPRAVLAGVIRGVPPETLRSEFAEVLDTIHAEFNEALYNFQGDRREFDAADVYLEKCLKSEVETNSSLGSRRILRRISPALMLAVAGLVMAAFWGAVTYQKHSRWKQFLDEVKQEPGLVVMSVEKEYGKSVVYGFRDPLSSAPENLAKKAGLQLDSILFRLEPYLALSPEIIQKRAISLLHPPDSVTISVHQDNGKTALKGSGSAPHEWITRFREIGVLVAGVSEINENELQDTSVASFEKLKKEIESHQFNFAQGSFALSPEAYQKINSLSGAIERIDLLAQQLGKFVRLEIHGHTSKEGSSKINRDLGFARAQTLATALNTKNLEVTQIVPVGTGFSFPLLAEYQDRDLSTNRRVSVHIIVRNSGNGKAKAQ